MIRWFLIKSLNHSRNFRKVSIIAADTAELDTEFERSPLRGYRRVQQIKSLDDEVSSEADLVVIDKNFLSDQELFQTISSVVNTHKSCVKSYIDFYEEISGKISLNTINSYWLLDHLGSQELNQINILKRGFDLLCLFISMVIFIPFILLGCLLIFLSDGRPFFYSQKRVGKGNKEFFIYKLRTMVKDAESSGKAQWAVANDARITKVGNFLRKTRIDEFPQLLNILKGEMSFVGPRPERREIIEDKLEKLTPYYNIRHVVAPGVTGWAQVNYGYGSTEEDALEKLKYDLYYIKNSSFLLDIKILLRTIRVVLLGMGQ